MRGLRRVLHVHHRGLGAQPTPLRQEVCQTPKPLTLTLNPKPLGSHTERQRQVGLVGEAKTALTMCGV